MRKLLTILHAMVNHHTPGNLRSELSLNMREPLDKQDSCSAPFRLVVVVHLKSGAHIWIIPRGQRVLKSTPIFKFQTESLPPECTIVPIPFLEQLSLLRQSPRRGSINWTNSPRAYGVHIRQIVVR